MAEASGHEQSEGKRASFDGDEVRKVQRQTTSTLQSTCDEVDLLKEEDDHLEAFTIDHVPQKSEMHEIHQNSGIQQHSWHKKLASAGHTYHAVNVHERGVVQLGDRYNYSFNAETHF